MALVQRWTRQVPPDHEIDETLTNIIPAFDYFAFTDPGSLRVNEQARGEIKERHLVNGTGVENIVSFQPQMQELNSSLAHSGCPGSKWTIASTNFR